MAVNRTHHSPGGISLQPCYFPDPDYPGSFNLASDDHWTEFMSSRPVSYLGWSIGEVSSVGIRNGEESVLYQFSQVSIDRIDVGNGIVDMSVKSVDESKWLLSQPPPIEIRVGVKDGYGVLNIMVTRWTSTVLQNVDGFIWLQLVGECQVDIPGDPNSIPFITIED